jgi:hypothetical protein
MLIIMEQTLNYMGTINPQYTQELLNEAQESNNVVIMTDKEGKPKGAYLRVPNIDRKKFGKKKDNVE